MEMIILSMLIAMCTSAQLPSKSYIPQSSQGFGTSHSSSTSNTGAFGTEYTGNRRPQQETEKNAVVLKLDQEISESGFHYSYETSNGIKASESGNAGGSQGGFTYVGDDGNTYSITFTADQNGFQAQGAHLPVAPPTPEAILLALQQNAKDEAAGIFDDGQYRPSQQDGGDDTTGATGQNSGHFSSSSQSSSSSGHASGTFYPSTGYQY